MALDHLRRSRRENPIPLEEVENLLAEESDLERSYLREERKRMIHRAVGKLNPDYGRALHLVYFEGFTNREAAVILRKSERQIRNLLYRAKQALKAELEKEGFVYENL